MTNQIPNPKPESIRHSGLWLDSSLDLEALDRPFWFRISGFLALFLLLAAAPSTLPALTPTQTFREFLLDIQQGDSADLSSLCVASNADGKQLSRDFQDLSAAMQNLRARAAAKFGADAADAVLPQLPTLDDLADATERIDGNSAQVSGTSVWPIRLIRIAGRWRIDLDWLAASDDMPPNHHWFGQMALAVRRTANDIATGRLTTAAAAAEAMSARQQAIPDTAPATQPVDSTQPSQQQSTGP